jgi:indolepyruvate ferredoxin oxidoreductase beta subunit
MKNINVLMVGVGGQGVILASDVLAEAAMLAGLDVKKSDSIGMAQRGGSVVSNIRFGDKVFSPLIGADEVDFLIGFEEIEAARWANYLRPDGVAIVADVVLVPLTVSKTMPYPEWDRTNNILGEYTKSVYLVPAAEIGQAAGNTRALNVVLLGFLSMFLDIKPEIWREKLTEKLPPRFVKSSLEAFELGALSAAKMMADKEAKK